MDQSKLADAARGLRHVFLRDMELQAAIGVHAHEHGRTQPIRINLDLAVEDDGLPAASRGVAGRDELDRVVDYEAVAARLRAIVASGHVRLVETLAERIAESCLADPRIAIVRVRVEKLDVFADIRTVGIEIERRRG